MSSYQIALLLHVTGAITYFCGIVLAIAAFFAARRRERPSEIAAILSLARGGVLVAAAGMGMLLGFGFWLLDLTPYGPGSDWVTAALALFFASLLLGGAAGQAPKRARRLAADLAATDDRRTPELGRLLDDVPSLLLNVVSGLASLAVLVLMVWKPGT